MRGGGFGFGASGIVGEGDESTRGAAGRSFAIGVAGGGFRAGGVEVGAGGVEVGAEPHDGSLERGNDGGGGGGGVSLEGRRAGLRVREGCA